MYLQYGCHHVAPVEWMNFDSSWTLRWERLPVVGSLYTKNAARYPPNVRYGDIVHGLPVADGSCRGVYASHVLEHLALEDAHRALENTKRTMRPGAIFRIIVPDLEWSAREYLQKVDSGDFSANDFFLESAHLGKRHNQRGLPAFLYQWLNTSQHLWMWDFPSLRGALLDHGFRNIRRCSFGDCEDPMFTLVESIHRFENAVAIEART